jgi:hypothetical protein
MDPQESQSNPSKGRIISVIDGTSHRWEPTLGSDKPFFGAIHDVSGNPRKRRRSEHDTLEMSEVGCGMARQIVAEFSSAGVHSPNAQPQSCSKGKAPALVSVSEMRSDDPQSLEHDMDHGYSLYVHAKWCIQCCTDKLQGLYGAFDFRCGRTLQIGPCGSLVH